MTRPTTYQLTRTRRILAAAVTATGFACAFASQSRAAEADLPAFPGAEGPGANATGGRGKPVYHVTNLNNDGPGSFRDAVSQSDRIVVFDVGGTINLMPPGSRGWIRTKASNLTIAGETAPGDGITIKGQGVKLTGNNVILRNLKIRPGMDQLKPGVATNDGITNYLQNSIIDHVSISWADDEALSTSDSTKNCTVQYVLIGEVLNYHNHGFGALIATENPDTLTSYHHNLFSSVKSRLPRVGSEKGAGSILNFSNNIIYNWTDGQAGYSAFDVDDLKKGKETSQPSRTNFLGNYYIGGPDTKPTDPPFNSASTATTLWQESDLPNKVDLNGNKQLDGKDLGWGFFKGNYTKAVERLPVPSGYVQSPDDAYKQVLNCSGAFWWKRDAVDKRIIDDTRKFAGRNLKYAEDAPGGGWIKQGMATRPADGYDTDGDGMPDTWEIAHGLDPKTDDHNGDYNHDGYTNIEKYFHDVAAFPAPKPLAYLGRNGRFETVQNWELGWKPSRLDSADIPKDAMVTVDSLGQRVARLRVADNATFTINDGSFEASEVIVRPSAKFVVKGGIFAPPSTETIRIDGNIDLTAGTLRIGAAAANKAAQLKAKGEITLGGQIAVKLLNDYEPRPGDRFLFASATKITGTPSKITDGWAVEIKGNQAFLVKQ